MNRLHNGRLLAPLRVDGKPVAVLTCERYAPFATLELQQMRAGL